MTKLRTCALFTFVAARSRERDSVRELGLSKLACMALMFCAAAVIASPAQTFETLVNFDGTDGFYTELMSLIQGADGNFYGTTSGGGASPNCPAGCGTVFKITAEGKLTTLHSFDNTDGAKASGGLLQATNGNFYGTTSFGGTHDDGTVFSLSMGLGSFVKTQPHSGKVGTKVIVLGNNLTEATSVTFNGTEARFNVVSDTEIKTSVPRGATTGTVEVTTPSGTLKSNLAFRVTN